MKTITCFSCKDTYEFNNHPDNHQLIKNNNKYSDMWWIDYPSVKDEFSGNDFSLCPKCRIYDVWIPNKSCCCGVIIDGNNLNIHECVRCLGNGIEGFGKHNCVRGMIKINDDNNKYLCIIDEGYLCYKCYKLIMKNRT